MQSEWIEKANKNAQELEEILSFEEYMNKIESEPKLHIRNSSLYLKEMFDHYGKDENQAFKLFTRPIPDCSPVYGQIESQKELYRNILNFCEEGKNSKFLLLVGPNGSSKSSLTRRIMKNAEDYSRESSGALYTFSWVFPIDSFIKGNLGFGSTRDSSNNLETYAHLEDKEISAILNSELKDHPLLLIPLEYRQELIEKYMKDHKKEFETVKMSYLYQGDISKRNRMIYDSLLKNYKGDHTQVLKHIRVERFYISRRYSNSAVTIEPQMHVDATIQQITMDKRLASLPPSLQSLNLFTLGGEAIMANRGILEFSDLLKRPLDAYKYLLMTMETQNINLRGIQTELDIFYMGSSNEVHLVAFKQHPDFNSFKGRINFVKVPYLLNYNLEEEIYKDQIENLKDKTTFEPGALSCLCLYNIMTRIRPSQEKNFQNKDLGKHAASLDPLEKVLYYSNETVPDRLKIEERKTLQRNLEKVQSEYRNENLYEGKFGISPRITKEIIYDISSNYDNVTFIEIVDYLSEFIKKKNEYDFLNIPPQGAFNNSAKFLEFLKDHFLDETDQTVRHSLGLIDNRSYEEYIGKYIQNISAKIKGEKIRNNVTGKFEDCDEYFIKEFEKNIDLHDSPENFRSHTISSLGAYSLDNPGAKITFTEVFPGIVKKLRASFREEQKKMITKIAKNLVFYIKETNDDKKANEVSLNQENRELIQKVIQNLVEQFSYSEQGALKLLQFLIKERY